MNFKSLVQQHSWLSIEAILFDLYPDEEKNSSGYRAVYEKLILMTAATSQMSIVVKNCKDDFDGDIGLISQRFSNRISELAKHYENLLVLLDTNYTEEQEKSKQHLKKMGLVWS